MAVSKTDESNQRSWYSFLLMNISSHYNTHHFIPLRQKGNLTSYLLETIDFKKCLLLIVTTKSYLIIFLS